MKIRKFVLSYCAIFAIVSSSAYCQQNQHWTLPMLKTNNSEMDTVSSVFQMAIGDIATNVRVRHSAGMGQEKPLLFAGMDYTGAWTRDGSINVWSGAGLLIPDVAKNSLLELINTHAKGKVNIGGQYWDNIIWAIGAWNYYLYTGDIDFLKTAYPAIVNTLRCREKEEFDATLNLFRGPAVYGDGISAYDARYTETGEANGGLWLSNIDKWAEANPTLKNPVGVGMPMMTLSTNCVYYEAYSILPRMEKELKKQVNSEWKFKAEKLKTAINTQLWNKAKNTYYYYIDPWGKCDYQEGLGLSFVLLFDIATPEQREKVFRNAYVAPAGFPCVWPSFPRYTDGKNQSFGRHSGVVWTHVQGFWANAAAKYIKAEAFNHELKQLTANTFRDKQFKEIYHPITGQVYGGLQEDGFKKGWIREWKSTDRQTWGATAYTRMILFGLAGMNFDEQGVTFKPCVTFEYENLRLINLYYRNAVLDVYFKGHGTQVERFTVNGKVRKVPFISKNEKGKLQVVISLK